MQFRIQNLKLIGPLDEEYNVNDLAGLITKGHRNIHVVNENGKDVTRRLIRRMDDKLDGIKLEMLYYGDES